MDRNPGEEDGTTTFLCQDEKIRSFLTFDACMLLSRCVNSKVITEYFSETLGSKAYCRQRKRLTIISSYDTKKVKRKTKKYVYNSVLSISHFV